MANEKRLIDANVVLAKRFTAGLSDASGNNYGYADVVLADDIENAPTVDAVEVVRCKDCNLCWMRANEILSCRRTGRNVSESDFCSYGEGREGE